MTFRHKKFRKIKVKTVRSHSIRSVCKIEKTPPERLYQEPITGKFHMPCKPNELLYILRLNLKN